MYTYLDYINLEQKTTGVIDRTLVEQFFSHINGLQQFNIIPIPAIFLYDYVSRKFGYVSENILPLIGYEMEDIIEGGHDFVTEIYHPNDFMIFDKKVFPANASFLEQIEMAERKNYI